MRKTILTAAATAALLAFGAASANAECATNSAGISKDGSLAPMQQPADASADAGSTGTTTGPASEQANAAGGVSKDGSNMPMASEPGGGTDVATSGQDVQRQQDGQPTAAAEGQDHAAASNQTSC